MEATTYTHFTFNTSAWEDVIVINNGQVVQFSRGAVTMQLRKIDPFTPNLYKLQFIHQGVAYDFAELNFNDAELAEVQAGEFSGAHFVHVMGRIRIRGELGLGYDAQYGLVPFGAQPQSIDFSYADVLNVRITNVDHPGSPLYDVYIMNYGQMGMKYICGVILTDEQVDELSMTISAMMNVPLDDAPQAVVIDLTGGKRTKRRTVQRVKKIRSKSMRRKSKKRKSKASRKRKSVRR